MKTGLTVLATAVLSAVTLASCNASVANNHRVENRGKILDTETLLGKGVILRSADGTKMVCQGCTKAEQTVVDFLYERGIRDVNAMSVLLGNIKQESRFHPNICEGGARVPYERCLRGGYGLIQFTTESRYNGLGNFANRYGGDPSELMTQLRYIVNEREWLVVEKYFKTEGLSKDQYMNYAYRWLGWGIYGNRGNYSNEYVGKLKVVS